MMEAIKKFFGWIGSFFKAASNLATQNTALAKSAVTVALGLFLDHNEEYAPEVALSIKGLREAIREGSIADNDVLKEQMGNILADYKLKPVVRVGFQNLVVDIFSAVEQHLGAEPKDWAQVWDDILAGAQSMAEAYSEDEGA